MATDLISVNLTRIEVQTYLDTGFLPPITVPPDVRTMFNTCPMGVYSMGEETDMLRVGFGGAVKWRKLFANDQCWLYVAKADLNLLEGSSATVPGRPLDEVNSILMKEHDPSMHFVNGVAIGGHQECARDDAPPDAWRKCTRGVAEQIANIWLDRDFHLTTRLREKMIDATSRMTAQDWWMTAGPVVGEFVPA